MAVNKCDNPNANQQQARADLQEHGLQCEEWGGDTQFRDISALKKQGLDELLAELGTMLRPIRAHLSLTIPQSNGQALARIRAIGQVDEEHYEGNQVHLKTRIPPHLREEFAPYIQGE